MAACEVLYFDAADVGRIRRDRLGASLWPASDGWRPCPAPGYAWVDPELVLRHVCAAHRRQVAALHAVGLAGRVRWAWTPEVGREAGA